MTTPARLRARLTDAELRPQRPSVEVLIPDQPGVMSRLRRAAAFLFRRRPEPGRRVRVYRLRGQRDITIATVAAYQEVVSLLTAMTDDGVEPTPEDWAYFVLAARDVIFYDEMSAQIAADIPITAWAEYLAFFGDVCRREMAANPALAPQTTRT